MTIRFHCPTCHHSLTVLPEKAGTALKCPECGERHLVPESDSAHARSVARPCPAGAGPSRGMIAWPCDGVRSWRALVGLVVAVGALSLLLALLTPALNFSEESAARARGVAMVVVPLCLVILLVLLHGKGTSCPACGRPWARKEGETDCLGREEFRKDGEPWVRARRRTNYTCKHCQHNWSATYTDEYRGTLRHPRRDPGT